MKLIPADIQQLQKSNDDLSMHTPMMHRAVSPMRRALYLQMRLRNLLRQEVTRRE